MAKSLFITYDGLTDPLGQSQILTYMTGLSALGHEIHILSCEKRERYSKNKDLVENICSQHNIKWTVLGFHKTPMILSKYYDWYNLTYTAFKLHKVQQFDIIHCRSYLSAGIGMKLKERVGAKYLFDMRGFWVDERVDGKLWNLKSILYKRAYKVWKKREALFVRHADHIISLTEAGKNEIQKWASYQKETPITVIPCSADMDLFSLTNEEQRKKARQQLKLDENSIVVSYLGSLGTWYMLDEMLVLFKALKSSCKSAKFLILTPDDETKVYAKAKEMNLEEDDFIIRFAQRQEVPDLMKASDVSLCFIRPVYSKIASSPTKIGELLSMGIPVVCNAIGDVEKIISVTNGGCVLVNFSATSMQSAIDYILSLKNVKRNMNREEIEKYYSLRTGINQYNEVYKDLMRQKI